MTATEVAAALARVQERIASARGRSGSRTDVEVVAVTKGHGFGVVEAALDAGLRVLGENRVQELADKAERLAGSGRREAVEWHLIGHLQRNKVKQALPLFDLIHSIDSERLALELSKEAERESREVKGLVQVNTSGEAAKSGFDADEALDAVARIAALPRMCVAGLMTMAPLTDDEAVLRTTFARARELFERCSDINGFSARHLSMGMSNDYEIAVEEGSTMVRLGTILFGERQR